MNVAIIYHRADYDGILSGAICAAGVAKRYPHALVHSYGWDYNDPLPDANFETYDEIYIVDLSVDALMERPALQKKIVWIDHHRTAIAKWGSNFIGEQVDGVAACRLCWEFFNGNGEVLCVEAFACRRPNEPLLVYLAGVYDVWLKDNPSFEEAKNLQFGLRALRPEIFNDIVRESIDGPDDDIQLAKRISSIALDGERIRTYCQKQNDDYAASYAQTLRWWGLTWCALNIGQRGNSDLLLGGIKPEHDACFAWRWTGKEVMVSLYHIKGKEHHDLSAIAKSLGGGGHKGACGFRLSLEALANIFAFPEDKPVFGGFDYAIQNLRCGRRLARQGWNGKGMWIAMSPGSPGLPADRFWSQQNNLYAQENGGRADVLPCLTMKTATGEILMGWLASQSDMLATDWVVVG